MSVLPVSCHSEERRDEESFCRHRFRGKGPSLREAMTLWGRGLCVSIRPASRDTAIFHFSFFISLSAPTAGAKVVRVCESGKSIPCGAIDPRHLSSRACCKMQVLLHAKGTAVGAGLALPGRENESVSEKVGRIRIFVRIRPTFCRISV